MLRYEGKKRSCRKKYSHMVLQIIKEYYMRLLVSTVVLFRLQLSNKMEYNI